VTLKVKKNNHACTCHGFQTGALVQPLVLPESLEISTSFFARSLKMGW